MPRSVVTNTAVRALDRPAAPDEVLTEEDVQEPAKLTRLLKRMMKDVARLVRERAPKRIDFEDITVGASGASVRLPHYFKGRARWSVAGWKPAATSDIGDPFNSCSAWIKRALFGPASLSNAAGNFSVGCRFQLTTKTRVAGIRFVWGSAVAARTVTVTLWRDSDGATLGTGTTTVTNAGVYVALFTTAVDVDGANLSVDLTASVWDGGTAYAKTGADAPFTGLLPINFPGGVVCKVINLFSAGNARPTSLAGAELYWVEPYIVASPYPWLVEDVTNTDGNTLALKSYVSGVATIRVEETA